MLQTGGLTESQTETWDVAQTGSVISKGIYNDKTAVVTVLLPSFSYSWLKTLCEQEFKEKKQN